MALRSLTQIALLDSGAFDHGDAHLSSGRVVLAHSATRKVEVPEGDTSRAPRAAPRPAAWSVTKPGAWR